MREKLCEAGGTSFDVATLAALAVGIAHTVTLLLDSRGAVAGEPWRSRIRPISSTEAKPHMRPSGKVRPVGAYR